MASLESRIMASSMPSEARSVLSGLGIKTPGAEGIEFAMEQLEEPRDLYEPIDAYGTTIADTLATGPEIVLDEVLQKEQTRTIANALTELTEPEQFVLYAKYEKGLNNTDIGAHFGKSREYASKLHHSALEKLRNNPEIAKAYDYLR